MLFQSIGFAIPSAFVLLAIASGFAIVYLLNEHRASTRDLIVPYVRFCDAMPRKAIQRRWPRWPILFILQLLAVTLLVAAASGIYSIGSMGSQRVAIILDCSLSMKAKSGDTTRFKQARDEALKILGRMKPYDFVTVLAAGVTVRPLDARLTRDALRQEILRLKPVDTATNLESALDLAKASLGGAGHIYLLTDRGRAIYERWHEKSAEHPPVTIQSFGKSSGNAAIVGLSIYQSPFATDYKEVRAYLTIRNTFPDAISVKYDTWLAEKTVASGTCMVKGRDEETMVIDGFDGPGLVRARLYMDDAQPADNEAFGLIARIQPLKLLVVGHSADLKQQLEREFHLKSYEPAGFEIAFDHKTPSAIEALGKQTLMRSYDVIIFDTPLPGYNFRFPAVLWNGGKSGERELPPDSYYWIADWNSKHELISYLENFNLMFIRATTQLPSDSGLESIIEGYMGNSYASRGDLVPVVSARSTEEGRAIYFGFDLKDYSLRKYQHLKILVLNALKWLHTNSMMPANIPVGSAYPLYGIEREAAIELRKPDGTSVRFAPGTSAIEEDHISQIGPYQISGGDSFRREFVATVTERSDAFDLTVDAEPIWHAPNPMQGKQQAYGPIDRSPMYKSWLLALIILLIEVSLFVLVIRKAKSLA